MEGTFFQVTAAIIVAAALALITRAARQPLILAYLLAGIVIGPHVLGIVSDPETSEALAKIGIIFLLFMVGLEMRLERIRELGPTVLLVGITQMVLTTGGGFFAARLFGFSPLAGLIIGLALSFSSTIVVIKLLSEKRELGSLSGRIAVGLLLLQDLVALTVLIFLSGIVSPTLYGAGPALLNGVIMIVGVGLVARFLLPHLFRFAAESEELLVLLGIAWAFALALFFKSAGLSLEIGSFVAGVLLAPFPYSAEIGARIKSLRDFFIILFFIALGAGIGFGSAQELWLPVAAFSVVVLLVGPLSILIAMGALGFKKRTGFLSAVSLGQVSEFSLILVAAAVETGSVPEGARGIVTVVAVVTVAISSYFILHGNRVYEALARHLRIFEFRKIFTRFERETVPAPLSNHVVLFGAHRLGFGLISSLRTKTNDLVVVDFNPFIIEELTRENIPARYGDAGDPEVLEGLNIHTARAILSTIPDAEDNAFIVQYARKAGVRAPIIVTAEQAPEALRLYKAGADFVLMPHVLSAHYVRSLIKETVFSKKGFSKLAALKNEELKNLRRLVALFDQPLTRRLP